MLYLIVDLIAIMLHSTQIASLSILNICILIKLFIGQINLVNARPISLLNAESFNIKPNLLAYRFCYSFIQFWANAILINNSEIYSRLSFRLQPESLEFG